MRRIWMSDQQFQSVTDLIELKAVAVATAINCYPLEPSTAKSVFVFYLDDDYDDGDSLTIAITNVVISS